MMIMRLTSKEVALTTPSRIANNSASRAVARPVSALDDDTCSPSLQKWATETACIFLGVVVANAATAVEFCNRGLVEAHFKLRVELVHKAWDGISMSTNFVASAAELEVMKQWLKKVAGLAASTVVEPCLP